MKFPKADPEVSRFLEQSLTGLGASLRPMFGCPAWFAGEQMFAGAFGSLARGGRPAGRVGTRLKLLLTGAAVLGRALIPPGAWFFVASEN